MAAELGLLQDVHGIHQLHVQVGRCQADLNG
jgi:hypothetical protein